MGGSLPQYPSVTCVNCTGTFAPELYVIVDAGERPDLVDLIKRDIIHVALCPHCATGNAIGLPLMVYRPQELVRIMYSPWPGFTPEQEHEHLDALFAHLHRQLGNRWDDGLTKGIYRAERADLPLVVDCKVELLPGGWVPTLREAVMRWLSCDTWEQARAVVQRDRILLSHEGLVFFKQKVKHAEAEGDRRSAHVMGEYLAVLEDCQTSGIDQAFAARLDGSGRTHMPNIVD